MASSSLHRVMRYFCVSVAEASATVLRRVVNLTCGRRRRRGREHARRDLWAESGADAENTSGGIYLQVGGDTALCAGVYGMFG